MKNAIDVTIVIVTSHRVDLFRASFQSLLSAADSCKSLKFHFKVVLNEAHPEAESYLSRLQMNNIETLRTDTKLFPGRARNLALKEISSDWIFFIDDDATVESHFFCTAAPFLSSEQLSFLGGPNVSPEKSSIFSRLTQLVLENPYVCFNFAKRYTREKRRVEPASEESMILCNFFLRTSCLKLFPHQEVFNPQLRGGEENDLVQRLAHRGQQGLFVSDLFVWHERRKDLIQFCVQILKYGYGRGLLEKQSGRFLIYQLIPSVFIILAILTFQGWLYLTIEIYLIYCALAALGHFIRCRDPLVLLTWTLFPFLHFCYPFGVFLGMVRRMRGLIFE